MTAMTDYAAPGPLTDLSRVDPAILQPLPDDPVAICRLVTGLVLHPQETQGLGLAPERFADNQLRPAARIIDALQALDPGPVDQPRELTLRVVGTCRHFAVLSCALLRHRGVRARARCGFATYFQTGKGLDHWVTEYWHDRERRWVRIDAQTLGSSIVEDPADLRPGQFLTGGEAWSAWRSGRIDASTYGVGGTDNWGPAEIRGNAIRDLAALNKVEMLPWDEWGRMEASYQGRTGPGYDELLDTVATVCASDDATVAADLYASEDLAVPAELVR
jgi:hypothetical protein